MAVMMKDDEDDDGDLWIYLAPRGRVPTIGEERGQLPRGEQIARYDSPHGSVRYVAYHGRRAVSALQVVDRGADRAIIANVYTLPEERRRGWARRLLERARQDFTSVVHSRHLTPLGRRWARAVRDPARLREQDRPLSRAQASYEAFARRIFDERSIRDAAALRKLVARTRDLQQRRDLEQAARELAEFYPVPPEAATTEADRYARQLFSDLNEWRAPDRSAGDVVHVRMRLSDAFSVLADMYDVAGDPRNAASAETIATRLRLGMTTVAEVMRAEDAARADRPFDLWEGRDGS